MAIKIRLLAIDVTEHANPIIDKRLLRRWDHGHALATLNLSQNDVGGVVVQWRNGPSGSEPEEDETVPAIIQIVREANDVICTAAWRCQSA